MACCHTCLKALQSGMLMKTQCLRKISLNWKNAMEKKEAFQKQESSDSHIEEIRVFE